MIQEISPKIDVGTKYLQHYEFLSVDHSKQLGLLTKHLRVFSTHEDSIGEKKWLKSFLMDKAVNFLFIQLYVLLVRCN